MGLRHDPTLLRLAPPCRDDRHRRPGRSRGAGLDPADPEEARSLRRRLGPARGFLDEGETLEACAARELHEETGLVAGTLHLFGNYSAPGRDPRGWTITAAYLARGEDASGKARAGDDAADCRWFPLASLLELAFDHDRIIADAIAVSGLVRG